MSLQAIMYCNVQVPLSWNKSHSHIIWFFFLLHSPVHTRLAEREWQHDTVALWVKCYYSELGFQGTVKCKTDNEDGLYLSSGHVRVLQTQRRWSCACLGLRCAGFPSHSALVRQKKCGKLIFQQNFGVFLPKGVATPESGTAKLIWIIMK